MLVFVGRGISALPLLTSTVGSSKPHPVITPSSAGEAEEEKGGAGHHAVGKMSDNAQDHASATPTSNSTDYPDDALFPGKRGPSTLFLGDCLNAKSKDFKTGDS